MLPEESPPANEPARMARDALPYRILVPLARDDPCPTAQIQLASIIAQARGGGITVLKVDPAIPLDHEGITAIVDRRCPVATEEVTDQGEVAVILKTTRDGHYDLLLLGWRGAKPENGDIELGRKLDKVIARAPCDVLVLLAREPLNFERILIPTAGGPHARLAAELAVGIERICDGLVVLFSIEYSEFQGSGRVSAREAIDLTLHGFDSADVEIERQVVIAAKGLRDTIVEAAADATLLIIGATNTGMMSRRLFGELPIAVARRSPVPVAMVHRYRGGTERYIQNALASLSGAFASLSTERRLDVYRDLRRGARPNVNFIFLTLTSIVIATLGLLLNSVAVIIGAMLVAPLMTPILGIALGIATGETRIFWLAFWTILRGIGLALAVALLISWLSPFGLNTPEILGRTRPTTLDLVIALASGMAGAYALAREEVAAALPGVAIAAALMPPLGVVGLGLGEGFRTGKWEIATGATLLFTTNLLAITLAGTIVFFLLGFRPSEQRRERELLRGFAITLMLLIAISFPLATLFRRTITTTRRERAVHTVFAELVHDGEVVRVEQTRKDDGLALRVILRNPTDIDQRITQAAYHRLAQDLNSPLSLRLVVIPIQEIEAIEPGP